MQEILKKMLKDNNMSLAELGRKIGKSRQYMSELYRGNIRLRYDMAVDIAEVFGVNVDVFLPSKSNINGHSSAGTEGR
jgi:transcriptional regulator with XRE-family HTH domain